MDQRPLELPPHVIVRVACWSDETLDGLDRPALATRAATVEAESPTWPTYVADYRDALETTRRRLWDRTVADPRFMRALALVNPQLARSLQGRPVPEVRNKAARHYETTLYRYLARAASRTEPCALWSGVALASFGPKRTIEPNPSPRIQVTPDLSPFRALFRAVVADDRYRRGAKYKLNPTLVRDDRGDYRYWAAAPKGPFVQQGMAGSAGLHRIIGLLSTRSFWTPDELALQLVPDEVQPQDEHLRLVFALVESNVLVGGLQFPRVFRDPWHALELAEAELTTVHARAWATARAWFEREASVFEGLVRDGSPSSIVVAMEAGREALSALALACGREGVPLPRSPWRIDVEAPWRIQLSHDDGKRLASSTSRYLRYQHEHGLREPLLRRATRSVLGDAERVPLGSVNLAGVDACETPVPTWDAAVTRFPDADDLRARVQRHRDGLRDAGHEARLPDGDSLGGPRLGAVHLSFHEEDPVFHGIALDPTTAYSRFAHLLRGPDGTRTERWLEAAFEHAGNDASVDYAALVHDHPIPNVLSHPPLWKHTVDPWGTWPEQLPLRDAELIVDPETRAPVLRIPGRARPLVVVVPTAAAVRNDPCTTALLLSSMHLPALTRLGSPSAHAHELDVSCHSPRERLSDGTVVQPRRTFLSGEELRGLARCKGPSLFARWQALATRHGWPRRLQLSADAHPPILVDRDSPLAIEAAFEGASRWRFVRIEEWLRDAWIGDTNHGTRFVADLSVPFLQRHDAALQPRAAAPVASVQRGTGASLGLVRR